MTVNNYTQQAQDLLSSAFNFVSEQAGHLKDQLQNFKNSTPVLDKIDFRIVGVASLIFGASALGVGVATFTGVLVGTVFSLPIIAGTTTAYTFISAAPLAAKVGILAAIVFCLLIESIREPILKIAIPFAIGVYATVSALHA